MIISGKTVILASLFCLCWALFLTDKTVNATEREQTGPKKMPVHKRLNVAHRGASFLQPENTIPAYQRAIADQANGAECDVYMTQNGVVVLSHDQSTKRTLGGQERDITKMNFEEFSQLDAGSWKGPEFCGIRPPSLDEYLKILKGTTCYPVVEIKMEGIEQQVLDVIRDNEMLHETTIISFSPHVVRKIRQLEPPISVAFLYSESLKVPAQQESERLTQQLIALANELDTNILDLNHHLLSETLIKNLQSAGLHIWCWTVDDPTRMKTLLDWGVESVTTNRPDLLQMLLDEGKNESKP
ncbi:MAG: glycerophosphodiester phosphodiesterase [Thermoguttaceae bacterium]